jgi:catechol 2,3-dioxygenase-like lactoylglutathione lyase family enzyme
MRIDHIAYRVKDRVKTAQFFINALGYKIQTEFDLKFPDNSTTKCIALQPPEKSEAKQTGWICKSFIENEIQPTEYHMAPEIFVSDGSPDSIVGKWVAARNDIGGIHHIAYQVDSVESTMNEWKEKGYAEFASAQPLKCPGLTQVFTKPSELTGVIYEFIERGEFGFCKDNVQALMESTRGNS